MFGAGSPLADLLATTDRARVLLMDALSATRSARAPVHRDAPQAHHLDVAIRDLQSAQRRLDHVMIVHTLDDVDGRELAA
jgi:hypothetical protein